MAPSSRLVALADKFRALHGPGHPLVLANVSDVVGAKVVAPLPSCHALATASYGVALHAGTSDDDLTLDQNITAAKAIGKVAAAHDKPFTVDLQDGYGDRLEDAVAQVIIEAGAVGINLEDCDKETHKMMSVDVAAARVKRAMDEAAKLGVPNFVVNARCDTLVTGGAMEEVIERGKKYLEAGATTVFVWGGSTRGGVSRAEVEQMVRAFDGRLSVSLKWGPGKPDDGLTVSELARMGVARISVGPTLTLFTMAEYEKRAMELLEHA